MMAYLMTSGGAAALAMELVTLVILLAVVGIRIASYVLGSLGLYTIARRRGIAHPWLAWIPMVHFWIVGSISDQFLYAAKGQIRNKRTILTAGVAAAVVISMLATMMESASAAAGVGMALVTLAALAAGFATVITYYMAMYDLYTSVNPDCNVTFLVLSIIFNFTEPFFVFCNRRKDLGMPPKD